MNSPIRPRVRNKRPTTTQAGIFYSRISSVNRRFSFMPAAPRSYLLTRDFLYVNFVWTIDQRFRDIDD
jgi:hypothetical protein